MTPLPLQPNNNPAPGADFSPDNTPYDALGGDTAVRALADAFYDQMESHAPDVRALHPQDLTETRQKFYEFLSGWLGGPQLYIQRHGHPRLRMRHNPFPIDTAAADQWLGAMSRALDAQNVQGPLRDFLDARFHHVAHFLVNR